RLSGQVSAAVMAVIRWVLPIFFLLGIAVSFGATTQLERVGPWTATPAPLPDWKSETDKGFVPYHQLTIEDFSVNDSLHPDAGYWVQPFIHYYFHYTMKMAHVGMV